MSTATRFAVLACLASACGGVDAGTTPVENPAPSIDALDPDTVMVGGLPFTLTVHGASFVDGAAVLWNDTVLSSIYHQASQVTAAVPQSVIAVAGQVAVRVRNPAPGGGTSGTLPLVIANPAPYVSAVDPPNVFIGSPAVRITVTGTGFVEGADVRWNGASRPTTFVSAFALTAELPSSDLAAPVAAAITVVNPGPGGGTSGALPFAVQYRTPVVTSVEPSAWPVGSTNVTLTVSGSAFVSASTVEWNGSALTTTYESDTLLTAPVPDSLLATGAIDTVTVRSPPPGGGPSNGMAVTVSNPAPVLTDITPDTIIAGGPAFTLEVRGSNFVAASQIQLDVYPQPTTVVGDSLLTTPLVAGWFWGGQFVAVTVTTPSPGGGTTAADTMVVLNPTPTITSISPDSAEATFTGMTVTVTGTGFGNSITTFRWNGAERSATLLGNGSLAGQLTADDLANPGTNTVTVFNAGPGGGESNPATFTVTPGSITSLARLDLQASDLLSDATRGLLYAAVSATDPVYGNSVVVIDPATASIVTSIPVGSGPDALAMSDDGTLLYVALTTASAIRRVDLATQTAGLRIQLDTDPTWGALNAEDIVVLPGLPTAIAVARTRPDVGPRHFGVAVYDDDVRRPDTTQIHIGSTRIEPSLIPNKLYGYDNESDQFGFRWLSVDSAGIHQDSVLGNLFGGAYFAEIVSYGPRVYASNGAVIDPEAGTLLGKCAVAAGRSVAPDSVAGRVFYLDRDASHLVACDLQTFTTVGTPWVPVGSAFGFPRALRRWGTDGLAYTTGSQVIILRTTLATP